VISSGKKVTIAYELKIDGKLIKSVHLRYIQGKKEIPSGLEKALKGLKTGDRREVVLSPKDGYGVENPQSIMEMPKSRFAKKYHIIGKEIKSEKDGKYLATVKAIKQNALVLNFNHPFAGKKLHYDVHVVSIEGERI
jgi:FKBP-type peptidyl-prolyl cis-trans isomerase SlyD